jgi:hypothetical protein
VLGVYRKDRITYQFSIISRKTGNTRGKVRFPPHEIKFLLERVIQNYSCKFGEIIKNGSPALTDGLLRIIITKTTIMMAKISWDIFMGCRQPMISLS